LWTSPGDWPTEVNELRAALCSGSSEIFQDNQLKSDASTVLDIFRELNIVDRERATKRRRITDRTMQGDYHVPYNQLIARVKQNEENPAPQLSGLHESIV
jgi:serine/threonine-protein kinase ATR